MSDLSAQRVGTEVRLHWTTPDKTTDDIDVSGAMTAQICRATPPSACVPTQTILVKSGPSEATDVLTSRLTANPQGLLEYRVTILNSRQRSAGPSTPAFAAAGEAPLAISNLRVEATEQGAELQWSPGDAADAIELTRLHAVANTAAPRQTARRLQPAAKEPAEMHFQAAAPNSEHLPVGTDAGGSLDATAHRGETYSYTAQRVRKAVLAGHTLEIRSLPFAAVPVTMRDTFPPQPPAALEAILSGQTGKSLAIDLSWRPNAEPDLAGYVVYRQELEPDGTAIGTRARLTATPVPSPGFHDATIAAGHIYNYSVTALDGAANESAPSLSAKEEVPMR
ncbi:MAG: hypothetical protein ABI357_03940 [Granulicella sp.]